MIENKLYPTIACCGIDCGLCPRYYTIGTSKCPGCCGPDFDKLHPSCSIVTCCRKQHYYEVCAQCKDYPCEKYTKETYEKDSFVTHRCILNNQELIGRIGIEKFVTQQQRKIANLVDMLENYDDGRSKCFYCLAAALLSEKELQSAILRISSHKGDLKSRAGALRDELKKIADDEGVELKLKR